MARVQQRSGKQNAGPGFVKAGHVVKQRKKQKVVLESNVQGQNNNRSVVRISRPRIYRGRAHPHGKLSFTADPPRGHTFIPAGNPQLTNALKEAARRGDYKIMSVSVSGYVHFVSFLLKAV